MLRNNANLLLQSLWTPVETPHRHNDRTPWPKGCEAAHVLCGQHASLQLPTNEIRPPIESLRKRLQIDASNLNSPLMRFLPAILCGKRSYSRAPCGKSIPLTQETWTLSVPDWGAVNWTKTGMSYLHAEKMHMSMGHP